LHNLSNEFFKNLILIIFKDIEANYLYVYHEDQTCAYVAQMQSTSHTQNVASTGPLQCSLASSVFHLDLHKLSGFWHSHAACFQDLAQTSARSSEKATK
jgi:hypothetical protein